MAQAIILRLDANNETERIGFQSWTGIEGTLVMEWNQHRLFNGPGSYSQIGP